MHHSSSIAPRCTAWTQRAEESEHRLRLRLRESQRERELHDIKSAYFMPVKHINRIAAAAVLSPLPLWANNSFSRRFCTDIFASFPHFPSAGLHSIVKQIQIRVNYTSKIVFIWSDNIISFDAKNIQFILSHFKRTATQPFANEFDLSTTDSNLHLRICTMSKEWTQNE